jgi:hypothetical protein
VTRHLDFDPQVHAHLVGKLALLPARVLRARAGDAAVADDDSDSDSARLRRLRIRVDALGALEAQARVARGATREANARTVRRRARKLAAAASGNGPLRAGDDLALGDAAADDGDGDDEEGGAGDDDDDDGDTALARRYLELAALLRQVVHDSAGDGIVADDQEDETGLE